MMIANGRTLAIGCCEVPNGMEKMPRRPSAIKRNIRAMMREAGMRSTARGTFIGREGRLTIESTGRWSALCGAFGVELVFPPLAEPASPSTQGHLVLAI